MNEQMLNRRGRQIPYHGRRHHNGENDADNGIFHAKNGLKNVDKEQDKDEIQRCRAKVFLQAFLHAAPRLP